MLYLDRNARTRQYPDPWFRQRSELLYQVCVRIVDLPQPKNLTAESICSMESNVEKLEAAAKLCGLAQIGYSTEVEFKYAKLSLDTKALAGALAQASASASRASREDIVNSLATGEVPELASVEASMECFVGFKAEAEVSLSTALLDVNASGTTFAGAEVNASLSGQITATGIKGELSAAAFVGAKAEGTITTTRKMFGLPLVTQTAEGSLSVGIGGELR